MERSTMPSIIKKLRAENPNLTINEFAELVHRTYTEEEIDAWIPKPPSQSALSKKLVEIVSMYSEEEKAKMIASGKFPDVMLCDDAVTGDTILRMTNGPTLKTGVLEGFTVQSFRIKKETSE